MPTAKTEPHIVAKLAEIMAGIEAMKKGGKNSFQNFKFIEVNEMSEDLRPKLASAGIMIYPVITDKHLEFRDRIDKKTGEITGSSTACHITVEWIVTDGFTTLEPHPSTIGEAHDTSDKALNKAQTAALKQLYMKLFHITADTDNDGSGAIDSRRSNNSRSNGAGQDNAKTCPEHNLQWRPTSRGTNAHPIKNDAGELLGWCDQEQFESRGVMADEAELDAQAESHLSDQPEKPATTAEELPW